MKVLRSPGFWGLIVGIVIGYYGIPVLLPNAINQWVWQRPIGFTTASIFAFGALGYFVGSFIQKWIEIRSGTGNAMLVYGLSALALLIGVIGFYRFEAANTDTVWTTVSTGLSRAYGVGENLTKGVPSPDTIRGQGASL